MPQENILATIVQTSKLLLIDEFCPPEDTQNRSLYNLLRNEDVRQKSLFFKKVQEQLEVRTFKEFVQRFTPTVWEWFEVSADHPGVPEYRCSLEKPEHVPEASLHETSLDKNEFYTMVMSLYQQRAASGKAIMEFDYSKVEELMSPAQVMKNAKRMRADLKYNYDKYNKLSEKDKVERNRYAKKLLEIRREIVKQYKDSPIGALKLALADTESMLKELSPPKSNGEGEKKQLNSTVACSIDFDANGDLVIKLLNEPQQDVLVLEEGTAEPEQNKLAELIAIDYDELGASDSYMKALVVSNYSGASEIKPKLDPAILQQNYKQYLSVFQMAQQRFIRAISRAVERMLDVKVFFDQATVDGTLPTPMIVANCSAASLIEPGIKDNFEWLIKENVQETQGLHIWFAIVPGIGDKDLMDDILEEDAIDLDAPVTQDDLNAERYVETRDGDKRASIDVLFELLDIMRKGKITTFFNYCAGEKTGFEALTSDLVDVYKSKLSSLSDNPYAVFCYPNFTILPKREACISIGTEQGPHGAKPVLLDLPGIYVDAAYVAAGLVVGTQDPRYLQKKGFHIDTRLPCVRFDIEEADNPFRLQTTMSREGLAAMSSEAAARINENKFGFSFNGEAKRTSDGNIIRNAYVNTARSLNHDNDGECQPLYERLTMDFVMQFLKQGPGSAGNVVPLQDVKGFIKKYVQGSWQPMSGDQVANRILHEGEMLHLDTEDDVNKLRITFHGKDKPVEIDIEKD